MVRQMEDSKSPCVLFFDKAEYPTMLPLSWSLHAYISFTKKKTCTTILLILTIRLFALNLYEVIADEAKGRINYQLIEIESKMSPLYTK